MTRIASVNVNGIRAAARKGMGEWIDASGVDILTLQEVRGQREHLEAILPGWHILEDESLQKGRAGVAIASREPSAAHRVGLGEDTVDSHGRWIEADFHVGSTTLTVVSAYVHSGEVDTPKQAAKWLFLNAMLERLPHLGEYAVVTGDLNVGHRELDIKNWRGNRKKSGFLPRERAYFDRFFGEAGASLETVDGSTGTGLGFVDVGRTFAGEVDGPYTWWSNRGQAFDNDTGWRIDYHVATPALADLVKDYRVDRYPSYDARWSDHAPVIADYAL
ncbi:MAG: exodeoxyribonuclease III [Microbacterium gubbeenense]|uniref:exodeoxyribonuclease III n=1 Tax=Microbacterium gubbeenense TaxID=159896 RepID=UPI003F960F21